ncbi:8717_t:CDS:1, partial [Paraglomus brasilianum]
GSVYSIPSSLYFRRGVNRVQFSHQSTELDYPLHPPNNASEVISICDRVSSSKTGLETLLRSML